MPSDIPSKVGRYEVESEIGRGAMGAVYAGIDPKLDRRVAIKMISSAIDAGGDDREEMLARFEREARISAKLQHPNVVAVYDVGVEGDEIYLVMELVDGETLAHRHARGEFPSVAEALDIVAQAGDALAAAHQAGIIHRDIKPGNMLITKSGRLKVMDFGVAKAVGEKMDLTRTGMMVGSPAYMAPEQVKGMMLDGRSDLFSLGVVLFEMLLRRKPFPADTVTTLVYQILHEDPMKDVPIPDAVTQDVADFMRWIMAKDREARIPDARTLASKARALAAGQPLAMPDPGTPTARIQTMGSEKTAVIDSRVAGIEPGTTRVEEPKKSGAGMWAGIAAAVVIGGGLGFWLLQRGGAPAEPAATATVAEAPQETAAMQIEATERPVFTPSDEARTEPQLEISIPDQEGASAGPNVDPGASDLSTSVSDVTADPLTGRASRAAARRPTTTQQTPAGSSRGTTSTTTAPPTEQASAGAATGAAASSAGARFVVPQVEIAETYEARRAVEFHVRPDSAIVTINGVTIGKADDWDGFGGGKPYPIPYEGDYYVELTAPGYQTTWIKIRISQGARIDTERIRTKLPKTE